MVSLNNKKVGDTITLENGAVATVRSGTYMDNAANRRLGRVGQTYKRLVITKGGNPPTNRQRKTISKDQAQRAFNKYWKNRMDAVAGQPMKLRGVKAARGRDLAYGVEKNLRTTTSYKQNPGRLEYRGVDFGSKRYKAPSAAQLAALARGRAARRS